MVVYFQYMLYETVADNDEPLLSGSGIVSKDVTDEEFLENWAEVSFYCHCCL